MRPDDYSVWQELLTIGVCLGLGAIPTWINYREIRASIDDVLAECSPEAGIGRCVRAGLLTADAGDSIVLRIRRARTRILNYE